MNILRLSNINNNYSFGSKNCPIKPFALQTKEGQLFVEEIAKKDINKASTFVFDCTVTSIPPYKDEPKWNFIDRLFSIVNFNEHYHRILRQKDKNSTILIAKDSNNKVKAFFSMESFNKIYDKNGKPKDINVGFIPDCLIDEKYRNEGLGSILLDKLIRTVEGYYSDVLLTANNAAISFYKKNGFKVIDRSAPGINKIPFFIYGYSNGYSTTMAKSLDPERPWVDRVAKIIE